MSRKTVGDCRKCVFFKVHDVFDYIGYCSLKNELVIPGPVECPHYQEVTRDQLSRIIEEQGWLYCVTCRRAIHSLEELEKYLEKYTIAPEIFSDEVASEESPPAD